jgi:hypothetical protein
MYKCMYVCLNTLLLCFAILLPNFFCYVLSCLKSKLEEIDNDCLLLN